MPASQSGGGDTPSTLRRQIAPYIDDINRLAEEGTRWKEIAELLAERGIHNESGAPLPALALRNHVTFIENHQDEFAELVGTGSLEADTSPSEPVLEKKPQARQGQASSRLAAASSKPDASMGSIIICNDRGGIGKTLLANIVMTTAVLDRVPAHFIEYDITPRLSPHFREDVAEWRKISQDFTEVMMAGGEAVFNYWDPLAQDLAKGGLVIDFGANVAAPFFDWAEVSGVDYYLGRGETLTLFVPVTADAAATATGLAMIARIRETFPGARSVLIENEHGGRFENFDEANYQREKRTLMAGDEIETLTLANCAAPIWPRVAAQRLAFLLSAERQGLVDLGIDPLAAARSIPLLRSWLSGAMDSLRPYIEERFGEG